MQPQPSSSLISRLRKRASFGLHRDATYLFWGMFFWDFGFGLYAAFFTLFIRSLGASDVLVGLLIAIQGLIRIAITIPSGVLGDRFDRRKLVVFTTSLTIPAVLIYGLSQVWWQMLIGMSLMILGNLGTPALSSYISDVADGKDRARAFSLIYTVGPATSMIIAPTVGGLLADWIALRSVFFVAAVSFTVSTVVMSRISTRPLKKHAGPMPNYREVVANPAFRAIGVMQLLVLGTLMIGATFLPNYLEDVHSFAIGTIGRFYSVASIGSVVMSIMLGRISRLDGARGIAMGTLAMAGLCLTVLLTGNPWVIAGLFLGRGGFMVAWSLFPALLGEVTPERLRSRTFAAAEFMAGVGTGVAPFIAGWLYSAKTAGPLVLVVAMAPLLAVSMIWVDRRFVRPAAVQLKLAEGTEAARQPA